MYLKMLLLIYVILLSLLGGSAQGDPIGWWKFDKRSDSTAVDSSGFGHDGTLNNMEDTDYVDGVIGLALKFDGVDDFVSIPSLDLVGLNTLTITAWVKRQAEQLIYTSIVFHRDNNTQAGTGIGLGSAPDWQINHELYYCWNQNFWQWHSGLIVPDNKWAFVALVIEPTKATLYLGQDGELCSATHEADHKIIEQLDDDIMIGYDNYPDEDSHGHFKGWIDDVRIYDYDLDANEISNIYNLATKADNISDEEITKNPDKVLQIAYENLQRLGDWRTNPALKTERAGEIAKTLLIIAKAKEAKNSPSEEVLKDYYALIEQLPDSPKTIEALCRIEALDKENGTEYVNKFLEKDTAGTKAAQFYGTLAKKYLAESDHTAAEKYIKLFIDKYVATKNSPKLIDWLISSIGQVRNHDELIYILNRNVSQDPSSSLRCAFFRYRASELFKWKDFHQLWNLALETRAKFPGTKLATAASAVLADKEYEQGNYVSAIKELKPDLFAAQRPEPDIIRDIDEVLSLYQVNTLRTQGINLTKVYEALAEYAQRLKRNIVAVHCYEQGAKAGGFGLEEFKKAALKSTMY